MVGVMLLSCCSSNDEGENISLTTPLEKNTLRIGDKDYPLYYKILHFYGGDEIYLVYDL